MVSPLLLLDERAGAVWRRCRLSRTKLVIILCTFRAESRTVWRKWERIVYKRNEDLKQNLFGCFSPKLDMSVRTFVVRGTQEIRIVSSRLWQEKNSRKITLSHPPFLSLFFLHLFKNKSHLSDRHCMREEKSDNPAFCTINYQNAFWIHLF